MIFLNYVHHRMIAQNYIYMQMMLKSSRLSVKKTDQLDLQAIMNTVKTWSDRWLLRLNIDKCKPVSYY